MTGKRKPAPKTADSNHIRARGREEKRGTKGIEHDERRKAAPAEQNWSTLLPNLHDQEKAARARQECLQRAEEKDRQRVAVDLFIEEQRHRRTNEFINFADIADWFARRDNLVVPNETARSGAYDLLRDDLRAGDFEEDGTSQVRFMHPSHDAEWISRRRTVDCETERVISLLDVIDTFTPQDVIAQYLAHCWIPHRIFHRWLDKYQLPLPTRFEPLENAKVAIKQNSQPRRSDLIFSVGGEHIGSRETKQFTTKKFAMAEFVKQYIDEAHKAGRQPTQAELEVKAKSKGLRGRQRLRELFRSQLGSRAPSRGRPTKQVK